ncbi:MAG: hypothetical protein AVDCRST_MAG83-1054, partial [uncultured Arthrobacter sp.]
ARCRPERTRPHCQIRLRLHRRSAHRSQPPGVLRQRGTGAREHQCGPRALECRSGIPDGPSPDRFRRLLTRGTRLRLPAGPGPGVVDVPADPRLGHRTPLPPSARLHLGGHRPDRPGHRVPQCPRALAREAGLPTEGQPGHRELHRHPSRLRRSRGRRRRSRGADIPGRLAACPRHLGGAGPHRPGGAAALAAPARGRHRARHHAAGPLPLALGVGPGLAGDDLHGFAIDRLLHPDGVAADHRTKPGHLRHHRGHSPFHFPAGQRVRQPRHRKDPAPGTGSTARSLHHQRAHVRDLPRARSGAGAHPAVGPFGSHRMWEPDRHRPVPLQPPHRELPAGSVTVRHGAIRRIRSGSGGPGDFRWPPRCERRLDASAPGRRGRHGGARRNRGACRARPGDQRPRTAWKWM